MNLFKPEASKASEESLTKTKTSAIGKTVTDISPSEVLRPEEPENPVSFSLVAGGKNLMILVGGFCIAVAVMMALSGDICLFSIGCGHTDGGGPHPPVIAADFWGVVIALGFFAISGTLGLTAMPALAISMGLWALMKATFSL